VKVTCTRALLDTLKTRKIQVKSGASPHNFMGASGLIPFTNVDATNLNCRCVPAYRYVC